MQYQVGACSFCGAPIYTQSPWYAVTPPPSIYTCGCRFFQNGTNQYYPQPETTPCPNSPPKDSPLNVESLTDCMKEEGVIESTLEKRITRLEKTVEELIKAIREFDQPKKSCKGNCKKAEKTKKVLKD